ncbi:chloride channel protein [Dermatobacter hominis]|uniref:chloride channel protein n=1 Tax=Dermatobacter hominis TaxID=2884263 RepID=UPI001D11A4D0|nr:chloride channel protein [Dermatobacter hominis]UDY37454.1 chloride channel protein [Dermatobacter hominis]
MTTDVDHHAAGDDAPDDQARDDRAMARLYLRLVLLGAVIGVPAALVAALFLALVHTVEGWLWDDLPEALGHAEPPWFLVLALPVAGAVIVWVARQFLPGDGGHSPLEGIGGGATPWRNGAGIALAAVGTLSFGAVLGPEAPLIALGSVVGMVVVANTRVRGRGEEVLATAGSFSAVSALFGGPLVAGILLMEGGLAAGASLTVALLPGLVAAAVGYVLFVGLGDWGGLAQQSLAVPDLPLYQGTHLLDLALAIVVGLVAAALILVVRELGGRVRAWSDRRWQVALLLGGAAVGAIALAASSLGADAQDVLFSGQAAVPHEVATTSVDVLVVLLVAKGLGYAVCLGCGFRGGPVFPAIFLGIGVAGICVDLFGVSPTWAVAVGAAAGMAAGTRFVFASLLFSSLLVGSAGLDALPAAVLATTSAWLLVTAVERRRSTGGDDDAGATGPASAPAPA